MAKREKGGKVRMSGDTYRRIAELIDENPLRAPSLLISLATCKISRSREQGQLMSRQ